MSREKDSYRKGTGMSKGLMGLLAIGLIFAGFLYFPGQREKAAEVQLIGVWDTSPSTNNSLSCDALAALVNNQLAGPDTTIGKHSRFGLIVTGGYSSSFEPRLVLDIAIPRAKRNVVSSRSRGQSREDFLRAIRSTCEALPRAEGSAIFRSAQIALQYAKSRGCGTSDADCRIFFGTDGIENADKAVYSYLFAANAKAPAPSTILDNSIVQSTNWCGYAQLEAGNGPRTNGQVVLDRWRSLFNSPVNFQPYCGASSSGTEVTSAAR